MGTWKCDGCNEDRPEQDHVRVRDEGSYEHCNEGCNALQEERCEHKELYVEINEVHGKVHEARGGSMRNARNIM